MELEPELAEEINSLFERRFQRFERRKNTSLEELNQQLALRRAECDEKIAKMRKKYQKWEAKEGEVIMLAGPADMEDSVEEEEDTAEMNKYVIELDLKLSEVLMEIDMLLDQDDGDASKLLETLEKVLEKMDKKGVEHAPLEDQPRYAELVAAVQAECSGSECDFESCIDGECDPDFD